MTDTSAAVPAGSLSSESTGAGGKRPNPVARLATFYRQVVAELRKVVWPTRNELMTYTSVVIVFVAAMVGVVALFDLAFSQAVIAVFGK